MENKNGKQRAMELLAILRDETTSDFAKEVIRGWLWSHISADAKDSALEEFIVKLQPNLTPDSEDYRKYAELAVLLHIQPSMRRFRPKQKRRSLARVAMRAAAVLLPMLVLAGVGYWWVNRPQDASQQAQIAVVSVSTADRSEERRVGKECRSRWSPYH